MMRIGLEVHTGLPTRSKLFCSCRTYVEEPNTAICPICTGMPGSKPMLNREALAFSVGIARALNCSVLDKVSFVRKVYFYPDLPKSFQITQTQQAVGSKGHVSMPSGKKVGIRRVQLEEDPAKIMREEGYTLIDFNRSGQPLVEIVTEPDITSEEELREFMTELKSILYYLDVDIDRELKADLNISMGEGGEGKGKVEIKNVTGMKNLLDAARYEVQRQGKLMDSGKKVETETRSYNEAKMETVSSREKESDEEYGFIFEPDLTVYSTAKIKVKEPVYASKIAKELAGKNSDKEETIRELVLFNRRALELLESAKGKHEIKNAITAVELLQRYGTEKSGHKELEKVIALLEKGSYPDKGTIHDLEQGKEVLQSTARLTTRRSTRRYAS